MGRKKYSKELKAQIALDAIKVQKTLAELAFEYGSFSKVYNQAPDFLPSSKARINDNSDIKPPRAALRKETPFLNNQNILCKNH